MAVPDKYKELGTFWKYYSGRVQAPYPTIFIGGNHEASNYLWELYHGGWVCDNIYYLGHAGVINFGGLRIGGISGIAKENHYKKGHYETSPYNRSDVRSAYHVREYDVNKLLQVQQPLDIFLSHDWPRGIERYGDLGHLMNIKKYFVQEIMTNSLGSHPNELLLTKLQPSYWFSAHLHVHYPAIVDHDMWKKGIYPAKTQEILDGSRQMPAQQHTNPDEIEVSLSDEEENEVVEATSKPVEDKQEPPKTTKFLSLDKCLPRRQFLQIIDIPSPSDSTDDYDFYYDMEWLSITRAMHPYLSTVHQQATLPSDDELKIKIERERTYLEKKAESRALDLKIPHNFEPTAPAYNPNMPNDRQRTIENRKLIDNLLKKIKSINMILSAERPFLNPQTAQFCKEIDIDNKINANCRQRVEEHQQQPLLNYNATEFVPGTGSNAIQVNATFIDNNLQPTKRIKTEEIESEIVIDDDEFL